MRIATIAPARCVCVCTSIECHDDTKVNVLGLALQAYTLQNLPEYARLAMLSCVHPINDAMMWCTLLNGQ